MSMIILQNSKLYYNETIDLNNVKDINHINSDYEIIELNDNVISVLNSSLTNDDIKIFNTYCDYYLNVTPTIISGIIGSSNLQTSIANQEILNGNSIRRLHLFNNQACHIKINNGDYVYLGANQNISFEITTVNSLMIQENDVTFNWYGLQ